MRILPDCRDRDHHSQMETTARHAPGAAAVFLRVCCQAVRSNLCLWMQFGSQTFAIMLEALLLRSYWLLTYCLTSPAVICRRRLASCEVCGKRWMMALQLRRALQVFPDRPLKLNSRFYMLQSRLYTLHCRLLAFVLQCRLYTLHFRLLAFLWLPGRWHIRAQRPPFRWILLLRPVEEISLRCVQPLVVCTAAHIMPRIPWFPVHPSA